MTARTGTSTSLFGTGFVEVLATCTSVATKPWTAFGAASVNNIAINATTPRPMNNLFANCILFLLFVSHRLRACRVELAAFQLVASTDAGSQTHLTCFATVGPALLQMARQHDIAASPCR